MYKPPWEKGKPAHVYFKLSIMDVDKVDDGAMEFSLQSYLGETWRDSRLNLSSYTDANYADPVFPTYLAKHIWLPDIVFDNTKDGKVFHLSLPNTVVKIKSDGSFYRATRYNLLVGCMMDFRFYPMDTQECFLKIATLANPDFKVLLHWVEEIPSKRIKTKSIELMYDIQPLKYVLKEPRSHKCTETWTSGNFTFLYANFTFVRRLSGSVFNVYIPSTLIVLLSWISFWLDVEAVPARVTLGVTSLLTLATQIVQARKGLPEISYMTAMDIWLLVCLVTVFSSLLEFAFAYQTSKMSKQCSRNDADIHDDEVKPINFVFKRDPGKILRSRLNQHVSYKTSRSRHSCVVSEKLLRAESGNSSDRSLDKISRKLFPLLFFIFCAVYWGCYLALK